MMRMSVGILYLAFGVLACGNGEEPSEAADSATMSKTVNAMEPAASSAPEILDVSKDACARTHPLIGKELPLSTRAHGVRGTVRIIDDCTLVISEFWYDGEGVQVEVYGSVGGSFAKGLSLSGELLRRDQPYENSQLLIRLPSGVDLSSIDGLSIWCTDVGVSFGDVTF